MNEIYSLKILSLSLSLSPGPPSTMEYTQGMQEKPSNRLILNLGSQLLKKVSEVMCASVTWAS